MKAYQAPPSMGFSMQEYWSGMPLPFPLKVKIIPIHTCSTCKIRKNLSPSIKYKQFIHTISGYFTYGAGGKFQKFQDLQVGRKCNVTGRLKRQPIW